MYLFGRLCINVLFFSTWNWSYDLGVGSNMLFQLSYWKYISAYSINYTCLSLWVFAFSIYPVCPSLFHSLRLSASQLRSAGAGIIQDLFPRVSCISTLDISDNGETSNCINERRLLSAPTDLQPFSFPSVAFASVSVDSACSFQGWMLISSVSFLPSPDTRPSNTCCWARTLTSRAGTYSRTDRDTRHRANRDICIHLFVWQMQCFQSDLQYMSIFTSCL